MKIYNWFINLIEAAIEKVAVFGMSDKDRAFYNLKELPSLSKRKDRDPRIDPQPGDKTVDPWDHTYYTVIDRQGDTVKFIVDDGEEVDEVNLADWQEGALNDTIVSVADV